MHPNLLNHLSPEYGTSKQSLRARAALMSLKRREDDSAAAGSAYCRFQHVLCRNLLNLLEAS